MLSENNIQMLRLLLEMGCHKEIVAGFLEWDGFSKEHIRYMAGPVVVYDPSWSETLPEWIHKAVACDRLELLAQERNQGTASESAILIEVVAYMYSYTLCAPVSHEWTNVYLWCSQQALSKHQRIPASSEPDARLSLSNYEREQYLFPLQRWLRKTVVKAAAAQGVAKATT